MAFDYMQNAVDLLQTLKQRLTTPRDRAIVAQVIEELRRHEASAPPSDFDAWCRVHAPYWQPSARHIAVFRLWLACGQIHRDEIAMLIGTPESPASNEAVRKYVCDLRVKLERAGATATIKTATRDGVYRTHDPSAPVALNIPQPAPGVKVLRLGHS